MCSQVVCRTSSCPQVRTVRPLYFFAATMSQSFSREVDELDCAFCGTALGAPHESACPESQADQVQYVQRKWSSTPTAELSTPLSGGGGGDRPQFKRSKTMVNDAVCEINAHETNTTTYSDSFDVNEDSKIYVHDNERYVNIRIPLDGFDLSPPGHALEEKKKAVVRVMAETLIKMGKPLAECMLAHRTLAENMINDIAADVSDLKFDSTSIDVTVAVPHPITAKVRFAIPADTHDFSLCDCRPVCVYVCIPCLGVC